MHLAELVDDGLGDGVECGEDIATSTSIGFKAEEGDGAAIEEVFEVIDGGRVWEVSLVVLQDDGEAIDGAVVEAEIGLKALEGLQIIPLAVHLGIRDEDDAIGLAQDELEGGVVGDLAGDGVEMEGGFVSRNGIGFDAEEVEEERAILCGGEGNEIAAATRIELGVDLLNVGGFTAQRGAAIHDLKTDGAFFVVDAGHGGRGINPMVGSAKESGEFTGDESDLVAETGAGFALMEDADGDFAGEAEGEEATAGIEREGFSPFDADERGEASELVGDVWGLLLEGGGFGSGGIGVAENAGAVEANAGAEAGLGGEELDDARSIERVLDAEEGTEEELIGICIQGGEAEEGGFARGSCFGLGREGRGGQWSGRRCGGQIQRRRRWCFLRSSKGIANRAGGRCNGGCQHGPGKSVFAGGAEGCSKEGGGLWLRTDQGNDGFGRSGFGLSLASKRVDQRLGRLGWPEEGAGGGAGRSRRGYAEQLLAAEAARSRWGEGIEGLHRRLDRSAGCGSGFCRRCSEGIEGSSQRLNGG